MNENTALFIFDFDRTLVNGHSHNYIGARLGSLIMHNIQNRFFSSDNERTKELAGLEQKFSVDLMKTFLSSENFGWKNEEQLVRLFKNIIISGHKIAIASFNAYPDAVKYALEQLLDKETVENIYIKSGLPTDKPEEILLCDKVPYIKEIMSNTEITNKANVFFMDDDIKHVKAAEKYEIKAVLVKKNGTEYIHEAFNFLYNFNEKHEVYVELDEPLTEPWGSDEENESLDQKRMLDIKFEPISDDYYNEYMTVDEKNLSDIEEYTPWELNGDLLGKN